MELANAFDAILSEVDDIRQQANDFLIDQIKGNPILFYSLVELFSATNVQRYKKLALIMIINIIRMNFDGILQNIPDFSEIIKSLIFHAPEINSLKSLAAIIHYFSIKFMEETENFWADFEEFLVLYRTDNRLIPFCIYLYKLSNTKEYYPIYQKYLEEIFLEITLCGIQYDDIETKLVSIGIFSKICKSVQEDFLNEIQEHIILIYQIAENSLQINEINSNYFYQLWAILYKIDNKLSPPLFEIASSILDSDQISSENRCILLKFIFRRNELMAQNFSLEDIEAIVILYFELQLEIDDVDCNATIFGSIKKIDDDGSYELFKRLLYDYLQSDDLKAQYVGLCFLPNFSLIYQKETVNDISELIQIVINASTGSEDHLLKALTFIESYLHFDRLNLTDSMIIIDFLINIIVECDLSSVQYRALQVCKNLTINTVFFEKMIDIHEKIQPESLSFYFSILICFFRVDNQINMNKYEPFLTFLIEVFNVYTQKVAELTFSIEESQNTDDDALLELYEYTLVQGSAGNLIIFFSFFNPVQLEEFVNPAVGSFINILKDDYEMEKIDSNHYYGLRTIKEDFAYIIDNIKGPLVELIEDHYDIILEANYVSDLQHFLCAYLDTDPGFASELIKIFNEEFVNICTNNIESFKEILHFLMDIVFPMSKWIYKIADFEVHKNYLRFLSMFLQQKLISYEIYYSISYILLRIVKPKRIEYASQIIEYSKVVKNAEILAAKLINNIISSDSISLSRCFECLSNLTLFYAYIESENGHKLLCETLIPYYKENQDTTEIAMLNLFSALININYYNELEFQEIIEILRGICERGKIYYEIGTYLFYLITDLSKINPEISPLFIEAAIETINENNDDETQIDLKASCACFLLTAFNQNHAEFQEAIVAVIPEIFSVFPISEKHKTLKFWIEIKSFFDNCKDNITKDVYELLISCLTRYLSYQKFTNLIFSVPDEQHGEIIQFYGQLIEIYLSQFANMAFKDLLDILLPHQPSSVEFILSLYS